MNKRETLAEKKLKYEGKLMPTNLYGDVSVLEYNSSRNVLIEFVNTGYRKVVQADQMIKGLIKDNSLSGLHNVSGIDFGKEKNRTLKPSYKLWVAMLERCYSEKHLNIKPTYKGCTVSDNFKSYPFFDDWCNKQMGFNQETFCLDKDLLVKGNKLYSESTCCFVPHDINTVILQTKGIRGKLPVGVIENKKTGKFRARVSKEGKFVCIGTYSTPEQAFYAYKQAKEEHIKEMASKWKDSIDIRVYNALMSWEVNITD